MKTRTAVWVILVIFVLVGVYLLLHKKDVDVASTTNLTPSMSASANWKIQEDKTFEIQFSYPPEYQLSDDSHDFMHPTITLAYPGSELGLFRGITMDFNDISLKELVSKNSNIPGLEAEPDATFAGVTWKVYRYTPSADPSATDQDSSLSYNTERKGKVFTILANLGAAGDLSASTIQDNLQKFLANFKFAD